jgi:hypothetical protein
MWALVWDDLANSFSYAMSAAYASSVRALRYVFEFAVQAALVESKFSGMTDGPEKMKLVLDDDDLKGFKSTMIPRLEQSSVNSHEECCDLQRLYVDLSTKGAHPDMRYIQNLTLNQLAFGQYEKDRFVECKELCRRVVEFVLIVLFRKYPNLKRESRLKELMLEFKLQMAISRL